MSTCVILLVCADEHRQRLLRRTLLREGGWVIPVSSAEEAFSRPSLPPLDLVIVSGEADPAVIMRLSALGPVLRQPAGRPIGALLRWARAPGPVRATGT